MNRTELLNQRAALRKLLDPLERITMTCRSCEHYSEANGRWCAVFNEAPPPSAVDSDIGCEAWEYDPIPF